MGGTLAHPDAGSATTADPFLEYSFTTAGTYEIGVSTVRHWAAATTYNNVPNTFFTDSASGVVPGQNYDLTLSLQRHASNPNAISLVGQRITIVAGTGKGESAFITAYDPESKKYTLDRQLTVAPDATSEYEIDQAVNITPVTDTYQVVLTGQPTASASRRAS